MIPGFGTVKTVFDIFKYFGPYLKDVFSKTDESRYLSRGLTGFILGSVVTVSFSYFILFGPFNIIKYISPEGELRAYNNLYHSQIKTLYKTNEELEDERDQLKKELDTIRDLLIKYEEQISILMEKESRLQEQIESLRDESAYWRSRANEREQEVERLNEKINDIERNLDENGEMDPRLEDLFGYSRRLHPDSLLRESTFS